MQHVLSCVCIRKITYLWHVQHWNKSNLEKLHNDVFKSPSVLNLPIIVLLITLNRLNPKNNKNLSFCLMIGISTEKNKKIKEVVFSLIIELMV